MVRLFGRRSTGGLPRPPTPWLGAARRAGRWVQDNVDPGSIETSTARPADHRAVPPPRHRGHPRRRWNREH